MLDWHYDDQLLNNYKKYKTNHIIVFYDNLYCPSDIFRFDSINKIKKQDVYHNDTLYCFISPELDITDETIYKDAIQWVASHDFQNNFTYTRLIINLSYAFREGFDIQ